MNAICDSHILQGNAIQCMAKSRHVAAPIVRLLCLNLVLLACSRDIAAPPEPSALPVLSALVVVSGDDQKGEAGTPLPAPIVVKAQDADGRPIAGVTVMFRVTQGGGSVLAGDVITASDGLAQDSWTVGPSVSISQVLEARALTPTGHKDVFHAFVAYALAGAAARIVLESGDGQTVGSGRSVPHVPRVRVRDRFGNPVQGSAVVFTVGLGGGSTTGGNATTNVAGVATVGSWTLGRAPGPNTLIAISAGSGISDNSVTFTATAMDETAWKSEVSMPTPRVQHAIGVLNGILYAIGGAGAEDYAAVGTVEAFDPASKKWTTKASMPTPRYGLAVGVVDGLLYAVGGVGEGDTLVNTVEAYDPTTNSWTTRASLPAPRTALAIGVVNGVLYAVGGYSTDLTGAVDRYDPATNSWSTSASMPSARQGLAVAVVHDILYAIGGHGPGGVTGVVEAYSPSSNSWTVREPMPTPQSQLSVAVLDSVFYLVSGLTAASELLGETVIAFDPGRNKWTSRLADLTPRWSMRIGVVNGVVYALGGWNDRYPFIGTNESWRP